MKTYAEVAKGWSTRDLCFAKAEFSEEERQGSEWYYAIVAELIRREQEDCPEEEEEYETGWEYIFEFEHDK